MNILALDTSANACSVALQVGGTVYAEHLIQPLQQAQLLLPTIQALIQQAGIQLRDLNAIAFGAGPGRFTGLRIGISAAQGLGCALNIPLIPISSHAVLAKEFFSRHEAETVVIAIDAKMNELYASAYQRQGTDLLCIHPEALISAEHFTILFPQIHHGVGDAWSVFDLSEPTVKRDDVAPNAKYMLELAKKKLFLNQTIQFELATPTYLRQNVTHQKKPT